MNGDVLLFVLTLLGVFILVCAAVLVASNRRK